jgi:hypothetical protein
MWQKIKCALGIHKSDNDYGLEWYSKRTYSECEHCGKRIYHS